MIRIFSHFIPRDLLALALAEGLVFFASVYAGIWLRFDGNYGDDFSGQDAILSRALVFTAVMLASMMAVGLYQRHLRDGFRGMLLRIAVAFTAGFAVMSLLFYVFADILYVGRGAFVIGFSVAALGVAITRAIHLKTAHQDGLKRRILVIGAGQNASLIEQRLKRKTDRQGFKIVGFIALPGEEVKIDPYLTLELHGSLVEFVQQNDIDELVVAVTDRRNVFPVQEILDCKMSGIEVVDVLAFFERQAGFILLEILTPSWLIFGPGFKQGVLRDVNKRIFDIAASLMLLIPTLPIMLIAMALIYLEDRGPIFYKQVRVGRNWKLFRVIKFRSMRVDAEKHGAQFAQKNDNRVTRIGSFMRKTRIDELPQLFNVLRGDMSFVGPRPERPEFVEGFSQSIPYYTERHRVKPGLTGWAQICYPYGSSQQDTIAKLQYDLYYVKNYSLFLDLTILLQTAEVILWGRGAR